MTWSIVYEARPQGAIGEFSRLGYTSSASTQEAALDEARRWLNAQGYEVRFPISANQTNEEQTP